MYQVQICETTSAFSSDISGHSNLTQTLYLSSLQGIPWKRGRVPLKSLLSGAVPGQLQR